MRSSIDRRQLAWLGLAAALPACSRGETKPEQASQTQPTELRFGFIGTGETRPIGAEGFANETGLLKEELTKLGFRQPQFVRFANGPDLNEALSGGSLDIGIYGDTPALVGRGAGLPTRLINQSVVGMDAWLLAGAKGPRHVRELAGKVVATSKGSYMHRYLGGLLSEVGLSDKVTLVHLLPADAQPALERGDIAAYAAPVQTAPLLVSKGAVVLDRASEHAGLVGSSVTVVTEAFLQRHPEFPKDWNALRRRAVEQLIREPERYYAFHAETVRLPLELVKQGFPLPLFEPEPLGAAGLALPEGTKKFLSEQKLLQRDFDLQSWLSTEAGG